MKQLNVSIEIDGRQQSVGTIRGNDFTDSCFTYAQEYLDREKILPISIHLPLQKEPFSVDRTTSFFEGLLPEGFSRRAVANWAKSDERDYLKILKTLGQECLGAIQILEEGGEIPQGSYEKLSAERVRELAAEGATKSTQVLLETHLSLTGASGKVGLYYDRANRDWYLPIGNAASTHIVKQSHIRLDQIVLNEQLCIRAAHHIGIPVPDSFIIDMNAGKDSDVLYATERYDRRIAGDQSASGLKMPRRLHQEDFSQALGIHAAAKYETEKQGYLKMMFDLLRRYSSDPLQDQLKLWDMVVFNYLIGNTDCHLKNYSLLYHENLKGIRLAPAYDIVCTRAYNSTNHMSFYIGDEVDIEKIHRASFLQAAEEIGIGSRIAMRHVDHLANRFEASLKKAAEELENQGFHNAERFTERIMKRCGYRGL